MAVTQGDVARKAGLDVSSVCKILNNVHGSRYSKETVKRVLKAARELRYDRRRLKFKHARRHRRTPLVLPIEILIYSENGSLAQKGSGMVANLSLSGAQLQGIALPLQALPLQAGGLGIRFLEGHLANREFSCVPVRFLETETGMRLGIQFKTLDSRAKASLRRIV